MIVLLTDFGVGGPYVGQLHAVLAQQAPATPVVDLFHDLPRHDVRSAAYLLPAYTRNFPPGTVFLAVVDPGVGSARRALAIQADHSWYVGPDNGLFHVLTRRAQTVQWHEIRWRPETLSATFHARDLFAPVAAQLVRGILPSALPVEPTVPVPDWPEDLPQVIYIDHFGNAMTGLRAARLGPQVRLATGGRTFPHADTYSQVPAGTGFWYGNANGLVEIALHGANAASELGITIGQTITLQ